MGRALHGGGGVLYVPVARRLMTRTPCEKKQKKGVWPKVSECDACFSGEAGERLIVLWPDWQSDGGDGEGQGRHPLPGLKFPPVAGDGGGGSAAAFEAPWGTDAFDRSSDCHVVAGSGSDVF